MKIQDEIKLISMLKNKVHSKGGNLMNAYISGSHLYGWESKDSDVDIRGCYILNKENFLGLKSPQEVIEIKNMGNEEITHEDNHDIVLFEIKKLIGLALKGNCNILEEINSNQFYKKADFVKLKQLINNSFGKKGIYNCYDNKTEIFTENGWKLFEDLNKNEKVATLNLKGFLKYNNINEYFCKKYNGKMFHQISKTIDIMVTPNHKLYIMSRSKKKHKKGFIFQEAKKSPRNVHYKCDCDWKGKEKSFFKLGNRNIKMDDWLRFFGIWIAEGCIINNSKQKKKQYIITISQKDENNLKFIESVFNSCGFHGWYNNKNYAIIMKNKILYNYLKVFGKSNEKFIPKDFLNLSKRQLKILFKSYLLGDGHKIDKKRIKTCGWEGYTACTTVSKKLADNLQEIILKLGLVSILKIKKPHIKIFDGKEYLCKQQYNLTINKTNLKPRVNNKNDNRKWINYKGKVYCVNVKHHIIYTRRNGKACWNGNSYRGMAEANYKGFILKGRNTIKKYLYVFRGLMAGIYCLQTGIIKPNIEELNKHFKIKEVTKLLGIKRKGLENEPLKDLETGVLDNLIKDLFDKIDQAYLKCKMPEVPTKEEVEEVDKFLIKLRLGK